MLLPMMRGRIQTAQAGLLDILGALLTNVDTADAIWDKRPDAERFTLREVVAHLADYELIWNERISRARDEDNPQLTPSNPTQLAIDNNYAAIDPAVSLRAIRDRRPVLVGILHDLPDADWQRSARWGDAGPLTIEEMAAFIVVHDGYHTSQIAQWLRILRG